MAGKDVRQALNTVTYNCLGRYLGMEYLTPDMLQSLTDEELKDIRNLGIKGFQSIRMHFPFDPELHALRTRWMNTVRPTYSDTIEPGDIGLRSLGKVARAIREYRRALEMEKIDSFEISHLVRDFHIALLAHWFPAHPHQEPDEVTDG